MQSATSIPSVVHLQYCVFLCYTSPPWPGSEDVQAAGFGGLCESTV
jgi:hypothetical protein